MKIETLTADARAQPRYSRAPGYVDIVDAAHEFERRAAGMSPAAVDAYVARYAASRAARRSACRVLAERLAPEASRDWRLWVQSEVEAWAGLRRPSSIRRWARRLNMSERHLRRCRNAALGPQARLEVLLKIDLPR